MLNWIGWNKTVYMYKMDSALNNLSWLICYKTKPNQTIIEIAQSAGAVEYTDCTSAEG